MAISPLDIYRPSEDFPKQEIGNINPFGISKDPVLKKQYEESIEAQKRVADALEARYNNLPLGRISAALLKPQLGGFGASFGSAQEELGNFQEAQRRSVPTVAQMRADVAKGMFTLAQRNAAARIAEDVASSPTGVATSPQAATIAGLEGGPSAVPKAGAEQETRSVQNMATALQQVNNWSDLVSNLGLPFIQKYMPLAIAQFPNLRLPPGTPADFVKAPITTNKALTAPTKDASEPTAGGRIAIPGVEVNSLTEAQYRKAESEYNTNKQNTYKALTENLQIQSTAGKEVYQTSQQIHDLAGDPEIGKIFALYEKGNPGGTIGQMLENQSMSSVLANVRQYAINRRLAGGEALTKLNNLESLMKDLQNNMQNAVINPTNLRTEAEIASMPSFKNSQDAFLRRIRYIGNEGLVKYENQHALERASKRKDFDPNYWTSSPEYASVSKNASSRRDAITKTPATQDRPSWMRGSIDETAFKGAQKENKRMTAKELRESANKED